MDDDPENPILFGDSTCGASTGQKILPQQTVWFNGVTSGFNMWVCTASGSAALRLSEHP
jgi:hypothetical protein